MNEQTLLLNADYSPIKAIPWQKAVTLMYSSHEDGTPKVAVVEEFDRYINCSSNKMKVPAVVALTKYYNIFNFYRIRFSNTSLYARDQYRCCYCGERFTPSDLTKDHVIPRTYFRQGKAKEYSTEEVRETSWLNVVTACRPCNAKKGGRTPEEAGMELLKRPHEPTFVALGTPPEKMPKEWKAYVRV